MTVLHWFRDDLRLLDNPALTHASQNGATAYIYIIEPDQLLGGAASVWLHHSLAALNHQLDGNLLPYKGRPEEDSARRNDRAGGRACYPDKALSSVRRENR